MLKAVNAYQPKVFEFTKRCRLANKKDFDYVFAKASKTLINEFVLLHRKNNLGQARLGLVISKKKVAKAYQRNRLKRILRESFRVQTLPGVDIIVLPRQGVDRIESKVLSAHLGIAWKKLIKFYPESSALA